MLNRLSSLVDSRLIRKVEMIDFVMRSMMIQIAMTSKNCVERERESKRGLQEK